MGFEEIVGDSFGILLFSFAVVVLVLEAAALFGEQDDEEDDAETEQEGKEKDGEAKETIFLKHRFGDVFKTKDSAKKGGEGEKGEK